MSQHTDPARADPLWTGLALVAPLAARVSGGLPAAATGVSIDTRTLAAGDLFFAITGDNSDGHDHVGHAFAAGAAAAVVDEAHADALAGSGPLFVVADVLDSLRGLGRAARARTAARVIAVTGSVGKTSTKEALRLALTTAGAVHAAAASYNNHWGVPLTLARMPRASRFAVSEVGMNHAGEITPLVAQVRPHVAIVTTVGPVHLEHFSSVEAIADAKAEIFSGLEPGGAAILNRDNEHFARLDAAARRSPAGIVSTFGADAAADARLIDITPAATHSIVTARVLGRDLTFRLGAPGRHLAENALAVLLAAHAVGADLDEAAGALAFFQAGRGRGARGAGGAGGGGAAALQPAVLDAVRGGDVVVVKGSNGSRMAPLVAALKERDAAPPAMRATG